VPDPQSFDSFAERYDAAAELERSHDFFLSNLPNRRGRGLGGRGAGPGLLAGELARHFTTVVAVDVSEPMLAIAKRKTRRARTSNTDSLTRMTCDWSNRLTRL